MSSCETHWLPRINDVDDYGYAGLWARRCYLGLSMEQDRITVLTEHLARTRRQLVGDLAHLRKLRTSHKRTITLLARGHIACEQSRLLLDRVDGLRLSGIQLNDRPSRGGRSVVQVAFSRGRKDLTQSIPGRRRGREYALPAKG